MTVEFDVCDPDMEDCSKKCKFGSSKATSCTEPCSCLGDAHYYLDRFNGKCVSKDSARGGCIERFSPGSGGTGDGAGQYCPGMGGTWVSVCSNSSTIGCGNYPNGDGTCYEFCGQAFIGSQGYTAGEVEGWGECSRQGLVYGFTGIIIEPSLPYAAGYCLPSAPYFCPNRDTCGASVVMNVIAKSVNGLSYIEYYRRFIYYSFFSFVPQITSLNGAVIYTRPDNNRPGQTCDVCGGEGQPPCPEFNDIPGLQFCE